MMYIRLTTPDREFIYYRVGVELSSMNSEIYGQIRAAIERETNIPRSQQTLSFSEEPMQIEGAQAQDLVLLPVPELAREIQARYPELFEKSIVYLYNLDVWAPNAIFKPENHIQFFDEPYHASTDIRELYNDLHEPRQMDRKTSKQFQAVIEGIEAAGLQDFVIIQRRSSSPSSLVSAKEMECYGYICHNIEERSAIIQEEHRDSSALHSSLFTTMEMQPPFIWDVGVPNFKKKFKMIQERGSHIRMIVKADDSSEFYAYSPQSDAAVLSKSEDGLPVLISEVDSNINKADRMRMILEGVVICRQRRYLLSEDSEKKSVLLGLYVHNDFQVDLYIFSAEADDNVGIYKEMFNLKEKRDALILARCLFNYRDKILQATYKYSAPKTAQLIALISDSYILPSYTSGKRRATKASSDRSSKRRQLETISGEAMDGVLSSEELQSLVCKSGTCIERTKRDHLAAVKMKAPPHQIVGYVKIMNNQEVDAFAAIRASGSSLLLDRVVLPTKMLDISARSVAFLPYGGEPLHRARYMQDGPKGHEMRVAWDILNIFARLHELHIAHLDIKPSNILWHPFIQSVRVIDFDSSAILDPRGNCNISGVAGTTGYAAPEVRKGEEYNALLADAFSCGVVLAEVIEEATHSEEKEFVQELAIALRREASQRWTIREALEAWKDWRNSGDNHRMRKDSIPNGGSFFSNGFPMISVRIR